MSEQLPWWAGEPPLPDQWASPGPRPGFATGDVGHLPASPSRASLPAPKAVDWSPLPPKPRSPLPLIILGSVVAFVGLVVLAVIVAGAVIGDAGTGIRTIEDHDHVVSVALPASWDVQTSAPVGATDPTSDPADPEYLPQIDASGGFIHYQAILVYVEDPVEAADHRDWLRSEVDQECADLPCDFRGSAVELTVAGYPAIQQTVAGHPSGRGGMGAGDDDPDTESICADHRLHRRSEQRFRGHADRAGRRTARVALTVTVAVPRGSL